MSKNSIPLIANAAKTLASAGIDEPQREARLLMTHMLGISETELYRDRPDLSREQALHFRALLERRLRREPMQYIIGEVEFWGLQIKVGPGVLVPRPETEGLCEHVIKLLRQRPPAAILDLCTGSGCIALALAREFSGAMVIGTDISDVAINYATENASINKITNASFRKGSLYEPAAGLKFDLIASNPPYIPDAEINALMPEVSVYEPRLALEGGPDGLKFYREILGSAPAHLSPGGMVALELGYGQEGDVAAIAMASGLEHVSTERDLAGIMRVGLYISPKNL